MNGTGAWLRVAADHPALAGHFPGQPIVPGVLLLDEALYASGLAQRAGSTWYVASVKFHRAVRPEETLQLECSAQPDGTLRCEWRAAQTLVVSASIERRDA